MYEKQHFVPQCYDSSSNNAENIIITSGKGKKIVFYLPSNEKN